MTRKDFVLIANALRDKLLIDCLTAEYLQGATAAKISACERIADSLRRTNERFDRSRFLAACGVQS